MKSKIIMVAALLGLMATACNKENKIQQQDFTQTPITISATYGGSSKVSYTESGNAINATWQSGDKLLVVYNNNVNTLDLISGAGTASATFNGSIIGTPAEGATLVCYVKDQNTPSGTVTVSGDGSYIYTSDAFLSQDGTLAGASKLNLYCGWTRYSSTTDINCTFSVNTSMMKFIITAPDGVAAGTTGVTLTYKSGETAISRATFTVGSSGKDTLYMTIPAGYYSGVQSLQYTSGEIDISYRLSDYQANFSAGQTYSKRIDVLNPYNTPLSFVANGDNMRGSFYSGGYSINLKYSMNGGPWTNYTGTITLAKSGDRVSFKGDNIMFGRDGSKVGFDVSGTGICYICGNVMSLLYSSDFDKANTLTTPYIFCKLFQNATRVYSHPFGELVLPATTLSEGCYKDMFYGTALQSAPELPATTLAQYCYSGMFNGCTILGKVKCLATDISASDCTTDWLNGVSATGTFIKASSMTDWTTGTSGIPSGWTTVNAQ